MQANDLMACLIAVTIEIPILETQNIADRPDYTTSTYISQFGKRISAHTLKRNPNKLYEV